MSMGVELAALILGTAYVGQYIDRYFGWKGYATFLLVVLGLTGWLYRLVVILKKFQEHEKKHKEMDGQ